MSIVGKIPLPALRAIGTAWRNARRLAPRSRRTVVLVYHEIGRGLPAAAFEAQMEHLRENARVTTLDTVVAAAEGPPTDELTCVVTFDDGYEGVYRHAFPILSRLGLPACVYLTTDAIGASEPPSAWGLLDGSPMLTWAQVREMHAHGFNVGSHTTKHGDLSVLSEVDAFSQLRRSRAEIEQRLGQACLDFAYPFGRLKSESIELVRAAGYRGAVTSVHRGVRAHEDLYRIPRIGVRDNYTLADFASIVRGDWDYLGLAQTLRRPRLRVNIPIGARPNDSSTKFAKDSRSPD